MQKKLPQNAQREFFEDQDYLPLTVHQLRKYIELDDYYQNIRRHASLKFKERVQCETNLFHTKIISGVSSKSKSLICIEPVRTIDILENGTYTIVG